MASIVTDRLDGLNSATAIKGPCRVATTANITLSGLQTVDGVSLAADDRVLVKNQTSSVDNGIYIVSTGLWRRSKDFAGNRDVKKGTQVFVTSGTTYAETIWYVTSADPITIDTTAITFVSTGTVVSVYPHIASVALLEALDTATNTIAYLSASSKEGVFQRVTAASYTSWIAADTQGAIIVQSTVNATYAWLRVDIKYLDARWFGMVADGTDSLDAGSPTTVRGAWVTATAYALHDLAWESGLGYRCISAHTSGTFATDLAAAKWVVGAFSGTDNTAALARMVAVHEATDIPMWLPAGKFRVDNPSSVAASNYVTLAGDTFILRGEGELLVDDELTASTAFNLFSNDDFPAAGATFSRRTHRRFEMDGITIRGRWSHKPERNRVDLLELAGYDTFIVKSCKFYDIPGQISWAKLNESVWFANNICERIGAGALRSQDSNNRFILNNRIRWTGDDAIDCHDRNANGISRGLTIMGNHLKQCEGIIALGAFNGTITGNTLEISHSTAIVIGTVSSVEGDNAAVNLAVYGNAVLDAISASADGSTLASSSAVSGAIIVGSANASLSGGDYNGSSKVNDPIVDDDYYNDTRASNNVPQGSGVTVTGNVIKRTRPAGSAYSAWGEGLYFYKDGWIDPTVDAADFRTNGVTIQSDVDNVAVTGNTIAGFRLGAGVFLDFTATGDFLDFAYRGIVIGQNAVRDCLQGVNTDLGFAAVTDRYANIKVIGNHFDLDPYNVSAARTSATAGTWNSGATDAQKNWGVVVTNVQGWEIHSNTFANLYNPIYGDDALAAGDYLNNVVHCEPADAAYSASNKGVAVPRNGGEEFNHVIVDCTPTSATFQQIINHCPRSTGAGSPPAGTYVRGHFMRNRLGSGTFIDANSMVLKGWLRMTTGTGAVSGTDWANVYTSHVSPAT